MEENQKQYELTCILSPHLEEADLNGFKKEFEAMINKKEGKIIYFREAERKGLAYPINKQKEGIYLISHIEIKPENIADFLKELKTKKEILRYLIVYLEAPKQEADKFKTPRKIVKIKKSPATKPTENKGIKLEEIDKKLDELVGL